MFRITGKKGFHISFENGWTVSVQFGPGNYCDNYHMTIRDDNEEAGKRGSTTAECAVWGPDGEMVNLPKCINPEDYDSTVSNRSTAEQVLQLMNWASQQMREDQGHE